MKRLFSAAVMLVVALAGFAQADSSTNLDELPLGIRLALETVFIPKNIPFQTHYPYLMDNLDSWIAMFQKAVKQEDRMKVFISFGTDTLNNAMLLDEVNKDAPVVILGKVKRVVQASDSKTAWIVEIRPTSKYFQDIDRIEWGFGTNVEVDVEYSSETRPKILEGEVILAFGTFWGNQTYDHRQIPVIRGMFYATEHRRQNLDKE